MAPRLATGASLLLSLTLLATSGCVGCVGCAGRSPTFTGPTDDCGTCVGDVVCTSVYQQLWCLPRCDDDCDCPNGTLCEPASDGSVKMCMTFEAEMRCTTCSAQELCVWGDAIDLVACAEVCDPVRPACDEGLVCTLIGVGRPAVCVAPAVALDVNLAQINRGAGIGRVCGSECGACEVRSACAKAPDSLGGSDPAVDGGTYRLLFRCVEVCAEDADCPDDSACEAVSASTGFDALCAPQDDQWQRP